MSWKNTVLLYGLALAAIPIVLHLLLRAKPKQLIFPALRLIQLRRKTNVRRLRLRHLWLLLLRMLVIAILVLALARPTLPAANYGLDLSETLTLAGLLAAAAAAYWGVMQFWKRNQLPPHLLRYRRSLLRGGTGLGLFLLFLLLVAWPYSRRVSAELQAPVVDELPVAAVFVFDTSMSMEYQFENKTALQRAQEVARTQLEKFSAQSRVAVTTTAADAGVRFYNDLVTVDLQVGELKTSPVSTSLNNRIQAALMLHRDEVSRMKEGEDATEENQFLRAIYIFTDLARSGWQLQASQALQDRLESMPDVHVYLVDVGVKAPQNASLQPIRLSTQRPLPNSSLGLETVVNYIGTGGDTCTVELRTPGENGEMISREKQTIQLSPGDAIPVNFSLQNFSGSVVQGEIQIDLADPLEMDDKRYFTAVLSEPQKILLIGPSDPEVMLWREAISLLQEGGQKKYEVEQKLIPGNDPAALNELDLTLYSVVCLVNVASPSEPFWAKLDDYVRGGGGLAVFLGSRQINPLSYESPEALKLLPTQRLLAHLKFIPPEYLNIVKPEHNLFQPFEKYGGVGELTSVDVVRYWKVEPQEEAAILARYTGPGEFPSLLERGVGLGQVMLLTTGVDLQNEFSDLPRARWSFIAFADLMMQSLSQLGNQGYNFLSGENVILPTGPHKGRLQFTLVKPDYSSSVMEVPAEEQVLKVGTLSQSGNFLLRDRVRKPPHNLGFSLNLPGTESDLTRLTEEELDALLGEDRYHLAATSEELEQVVKLDRVGREIFPVILGLLLVVFCTEHLVANHFYDPDPTD